MPVWVMWYLVGMFVTILLFVYEFKRTGITLSNNKKAQFITPSNPLKPRYFNQKT
jgi:hypothetical protein